jgi:hypothetical protein
MKYFIDNCPSRIPINFYENYYVRILIFFEINIISNEVSPLLIIKNIIFQNKLNPLLDLAKKFIKIIL